jgi:phenylpropionate dioxygenase-like ring-hydroxylating dioxygenase large terminal subunit
MIETQQMRPRPLEPRLYLDPEVLAGEMDAIFARTWQYAGHVSQLPSPGSYLTTTAGDQPVLVLRTQEGELRAFRNVCRHRGSELLSGTGTCKRAIRCRYHGWTYDSSDGRLLGVPEHLSYGDLDKGALGLFPARVESFGGLIFVNLDPRATPLAEQAAGMLPLLERYRLADLECFSSGDSGSQPANWKIVADNYLEGYHVPIAHPGLMRLLDYQRYDVELHEDWVRFDAPLREKPSENRTERLYQRLVRPMPGLNEGDRRCWRYLFIYPNTTIDLYPDQVNVWKIMPDGVAETKDLWACFRPAGAGPVTRLVQRLNNRLNTEVLAEDVDLVGRVQSGIRSSGFELGPLSGREAAVGWFAARIRRSLGEVD